MFSGPLRFELIGAHVGGALVGRRGLALTRGGAPQAPPLRHAAGKGELKVARSQLEVGPNKGATAMPRVGVVF